MKSRADAPLDRRILLAASVSFSQPRLAVPMDVNDASGHGEPGATVGDRRVHSDRCRQEEHASVPERDKPWIFRTYAGYGNPRVTNARYKTNLDKGQTGLSVAFDLPT